MLLFCSAWFFGTRAFQVSRTYWWSDSVLWGVQSHLYCHCVAALVYGTICKDKARAMPRTGTARRKIMLPAWFCSWNVLEPTFPWKTLSNQRFFNCFSMVFGGRLWNLLQYGFDLSNILKDTVSPWCSWHSKGRKDCLKRTALMEASIWNCLDTK
jgi:hypothetical protein